MAANQDRAVIYDRSWNTAGEFMVAMTDEQHAVVRSGPADALEPGERYMASIYGRYYACEPESSPDGLVLRLNAWGKDAPAGAA